MSLNFRYLKYLPIYTIPVFAYISFFGGGVWSYALVLYAFGLVPLLDFLTPINPNNHSEAEEALVKNDRFYDFLLYTTIPIQYTLLILFFFAVQQAHLSRFELVGIVLSFGICCGGIGINVAHELGHRKTLFEQRLAKVLLLTSLYMHFFIEHNRGHHKNVATEADPATARYGEIVYFFWLRSVVNSYLSAWHLENDRLLHLGKGIVSLHNEMIQYSLIQFAFLGAIFYFFGGFVLSCFVVSAVIGFLLLETINYVEHYGLMRRKNEGGIYERILPVHSWNSEHLIGRILLFELTRHSDHHFRSTRKYQILRYFDESPQMPAGYPAMILLSLVPPLWFFVMHRHIKRYKAQHPQAAALA